MTCSTSWPNGAMPVVGAQWPITRAACTLTDQRFETAVGHLQQLRFERVPTQRLMRRAFELRANVSPYDACYVALAERLDCELITADGRLAAAPGPRCAIRVLR